MRKTFFCMAIVLGGVFFLFPQAEAATIVNGSITEPTTWSEEASPYIVYGRLDISDTLTLEEGVVVKFGTGGGLSVGRNGSIQGSQVTFTSLYDDEHGGMVDGEASAQEPALSLGWSAIESSGEVSLENSHFYYGGKGTKGVLEIYGGTVTLLDNTFRYAKYAYVQHGGTGMVKGNSFEDMERAILQNSGTITFGGNDFSHIEGESYLLTTDSFTNEGGNTGEGTVNLLNMVFESDKILPGDSLPYQIQSAKINNGVTVTFEEGSIIKFWNASNSIINDGTLKALGTKEKPVIFTSVEDDTAGGDSNKNGTTTTPSAGQWGRIYNNSSGTIYFEYTTLRYGGAVQWSNDEAGLITNYGTMTASNSLFSNSLTKLINVGGIGKVTIEKSELLRAERGIFATEEGEVTIHKSNILDTEGYRIQNKSSKVADASNNYWGNETGPTVGGNDFGGPVVTTKVLYDPYFISSAICKVDCFSNVLFLPGILGSRLYEENGGDEDRLWFSSSDDRQERMEMNDDGTSKKDVYTKESTNGILDVAYGNLYKSFLEDLNDWKTEGVFNNYAVLPYDWRLSLEDIVMNGKVEDGKLRYTAHNTDLEQSYLYQQVKSLQESSKSEKITLIGHSNGGLVIKAFIQKLKDTHDPLYNKIDKVIFVGVPQTGTPDSIVSLLYGSKIGTLWIGTSAKRARSLANHMPTMYNLLPSQKLFNQLDAPIEFKGDNVPASWKERYGDNINTYGEFEDFLTGDEGRGRPAYADLYDPEILSESFLEQAKDIHATLDAWSPPASTQVIQIAGWGLYTVAGLEVVDDKKCKFDAHQLIDGRPVCYAREPTTTIRDKRVLDGDGTVLVKSAHDIPVSSKVKKYWINLQKYNSIIELNIDREHKSLLEVSTLPSFIKSLIKNNIADTTGGYIYSYEPPATDDPYIKYEIHSPLNITVTDSEGNQAGWDAESGQIVENIKGAQYFEIGETKTILIPRETEHQVRLQAYDEGSFTLSITQLEGEGELSETTFRAIPAFQDTSVKVTPDSGGKVRMDIDFHNDGVAEMAFAVEEGETVDYPNPISEEAITPEGDTTEDKEGDDNSDKKKKKSSAHSGEAIRNILYPLSSNKNDESYFQPSIAETIENLEVSVQEETSSTEKSDPSSDPSNSQNLLAYGVAAKGVRLKGLLKSLKGMLRLKK